MPQPDTRCRPVSLVQILEELLVAESLAVLDCVLEDLVGEVDPRQRSTRVELHHVIDVAAQDRRFHVPGTDHVIRHQQKLLVLNPRVLGKDLGQFGHRPHGGDVLQDQVKDRHEVRLTGTEASVQVARLAVDRIDR